MKTTLKNVLPPIFKTWNDYRNSLLSTPSIVERILETEEFMIQQLDSRENVEYVTTWNYIKAKCFTELQELIKEKIDYIESAPFYEHEAGRIKLEYSLKQFFQLK